MKLARFASIRLSSPAPERLGRWTYRSSAGVEVTTNSLRLENDITNEPPSSDLRGPHLSWPYESSRANVGVTAIVDAGDLALAKNNRIIVPSDARLRAEAALIEYGDILAVSNQCQRAVRSPKPCVAVLPESDAELRLCSTADGINAPFRRRPRLKLLPELRSNSPIGRVVGDRVDGLALLADGLSEDGAAASVREYFRLFERAFRAGPSDCIEPLTAFLRSGESALNYDTDEISDWFLRLRPYVTHADRRELFARAADVEPHLGRIEYAAYDAHANKEEWRTVAPTRRSAVRLAAGIDVDGSTVHLFRPDASVVVSWTDPFAVFPIEFDIDLTVAPPWVSNMPGYTFDEGGQFSTSVNVVSTYAGDKAERYQMVLDVRHNRTPNDVSRP